MKLFESKKTLRNNFKIVNERKRELYNENIKLQQEMKRQKTLNKELNELVVKYCKEKEELKKELKSIKTKYTKLKNKISVEVVAPKIEDGNKFIEEHFRKEKENARETN